MNTNKTEYDLICSLGANCSVAGQLKLRKLRQISLPLDWTWFNNEKTLYKIAEGFKNNFSEFMKKENLITLTGNDWSSWHTNRYQYEDKATGIRYFNHFYKVSDESKEQDRVIALFRKRCKRFDYLLQNSKKVLLILSVKKDIEIEPVKYLLEVISRKYPTTEINLRYQGFSATKDEVIKLPNLEIYRYKRDDNVYDYDYTNWEWNYLDNIKLSELFYSNCKKLRYIEEDKSLIGRLKSIIVQVVDFKIIKKGLSINLLKILNTVFYFKLYIFGARLQFTIGKERNE